jgi:hypothetical protein
MKIVNVIIGLAILALAMFMMDSLVMKPTTTEISVLWDVTDTSIGKPGSNEIIRLYHLDGNDMWNGAEFRLSTLSNVNFNKTEVFSLQPRNKWLSNELEREKEIRRFTSKVAFLIDTPQSDSVGKPSSSIYWPLFAELKRLGEPNGEIGGNYVERRIMVIQSDLMENNASLSLYDPKQLKRFTSDPNSAKFLTDNLAQIPSLEGVEIYMIYRPMNAMDSERYTLISEVLKNLLQEKGAKVYRSANLIR